MVHKEGMRSICICVDRIHTLHTRAPTSHGLSGSSVLLAQSVKLQCHISNKSIKADAKAQTTLAQSRVLKSAMP